MTRSSRASDRNQERLAQHLDILSVLSILSSSKDEGRKMPSRGFTLVELAVTTAVTALLLTTICAIYFSTATEWEHQQGLRDAVSATSRACSRLEEYIAQGVSAQLVDRFGSGFYDTLLVNLPLQTYSGASPWVAGQVPNLVIIRNTYGGYMPDWTSDSGRLRFQYTSSNVQWVAFYLSDSTGRYDRTGSILWAATADRTSTPMVVTPDTAWSMETATSGRIAPLTSMRFTVDDSMKPKRVTITVYCSYKLKSTTKQITQVRSASLRNAN